MYIKAIKHIRRLRGGSQAQLMAARTTDTSTSLNSRAIRKPRVYWRTTTWRLARMVGLSVPEPVIIYVDADMSMPRSFGNTRSRSMKSAASHGLRKYQKHERVRWHTRL